MKIPDRDAPERISFNAKISLEIVFCRIIQHDFSADRQQNWPMEKNQKDEADREANHHATPNSPVTPRLCLMMLGHGAESIAASPQSKEQMAPRRYSRSR
jgi:hypothetical protein